MKHLHSGKVRDLYDLDGDLLLVASDRLSIYDVVLPTPVPDKGAVLTQLSAWWFDQLADLVGNHLISATDVPAEFAGRALRCRRLEMLPVECIAQVAARAGILVADRAAFVGAAPAQVTAVAERIASVVAGHPTAASYLPPAIL